MHLKYFLNLYLIMNFDFLNFHLYYFKLMINLLKFYSLYYLKYYQLTFIFYLYQDYEIENYFEKLK